MNPAFLLLMSLPFDINLFDFVGGGLLKLWMVTAVFFLLTSFTELRSKWKKSASLNDVLRGSVLWILPFLALFFFSAFLQDDYQSSLFLEEVGLFVSRLVLFYAGVVMVFLPRIPLSELLRFQAGYSAFLVLTGVLIHMFQREGSGQFGLYQVSDRVFYPFPNPNLAALYILISLMCAVTVSARAGNLKLSWIQPVLFSGLLLAGSRAALGGIIVFLFLVLGLSFFFRKGKIWKPVFSYALLGIVTGVLLTLTDFLLSALRVTGSRDDMSIREAGVGGVFSRIDYSTSETDRIGIWQRAWGYFVENPIFGVGIRGFASLTGRDPHNFWLGLLTETGVVGFVMVITLLVFLHSRLFSVGTLDSGLLQASSLTLAAVALFTSDRYFALLWVFFGVAVSWMHQQITDACNPVREDQAV
jgi:O-antigen ligase